MFIPINMTKNVSIFSYALNMMNRMRCHCFFDDIARTIIILYNECSYLIR